MPRPVRPTLEVTPEGVTLRLPDGQALWIVMGGGDAQGEYPASPVTIVQRHLGIAHVTVTLLCDLPREEEPAKEKPEEGDA